MRAKQIRRIEANKGSIFPFLPTSEDRYLSVALEGVWDKLNSTPEATAKRMRREKLEAEKDDPRYMYHWWERNYDDAFERQHSLETRSAAYLLNLAPGRPTLATYEGSSGTNIVEYRTISQQEVDNCFARLWEKSKVSVARRRVRPESGSRGAVVPESLLVVSDDGDGCIDDDGDDDERYRQAEAKARQNKDLHDKRLGRQCTQKSFSERLSRPRVAPHWNPPATMTFEPVLESSPLKRAKAKSSLPPLVSPAPKAPLSGEDARNESCHDAQMLRRKAGRSTLAMSARSESRGTDEGTGRGGGNDEKSKSSSRKDKSEESDNDDDDTDEDNDDGEENEDDEMSSLAIEEGSNGLDEAESADQESYSDSDVEDNDTE